MTSHWRIASNGSTAASVYGVKPAHARQLRRRKAPLMVMHQLALTLFIATALPAYQADNTERNKRDQDGTTMTAEKQGNSKPDVELAAKIRRSIVKDKSLSTTAHNIKVIVNEGKVWLRGPVKTEIEKDRIVELAKKSAGDQNVTNLLEVSKGDS